jgi:hypothetical protein
MKTKNHIKIAYLFFVLFLTFSIGCKKDDSSTAKVYVCGGSEGAVDFAKCWVNGDGTILTSIREAYCCFVSGNDIYYSGNDVYNGECFPTYWKNGNLVQLPNLSSQCDNGEGFFVSGNDVYITTSGGAGCSGNGYWKNGQLVVLPNCENSEAIFVSEMGDVYVAGTGFDPVTGFGYKARYWVNGSEIDLVGPSNSISNAVDIKVVGNDVYVAGYKYSTILGHTVATVWKNGVAIALSSAPSWAYSIDVANGTTYVCGEVKDLSNYNLIATYWKNSQETQLTSSNSYAAGNCIKVNGSDVYIAGYNDDQACYWKNGVINLLPKTSGSATEYANSIWIK